MRGLTPACRPRPHPPKAPPAHPGDVDLDKLRTVVKVNGKTTIEFDTNHMLFGIARYISTMSKYLTLHPGDMVWMGTEGSAPNLKDGDVVEIEINQIGKLRNRFVREK